MSEKDKVLKTHMDFISRLAMGVYSRRENPGYSACERCGMSWGKVIPPTTYIANGSGMFALCLECKLELSPNERLPYYFAVYERWKYESLELSFSEDELRAAVLGEVLNG